MQSKINKLLTIILISLLCINNVKAQLVEGSKVIVDSDTWIVTDAKDASDKCKIDNPNEPDGFKVDSNYFPTLGYAYENTCTSGGWASQTFCSQAKDQFHVSLDIQKQMQYSNSAPGGGENGGNGGYSPTPDPIPTPGKSAHNNDGKNILADNSNNNSNKITNSNFDSIKIDNILTDGTKLETTIQKVWTLTGTEYGLDFYMDPRGGPAGAHIYSAQSIEGLGYFVDYYKRCFVNGAHRTCKKKVPGCAGNCTDERGYPTSECCNPIEVIEADASVYATATDQTNWKDDCSRTTIQDWKDYVESSIPSCPEIDGDVVNNATCYADEAMYRQQYTASKFVCNNVGPTKVEAYGVQLSINGKEAYCVTPSAGYNKTYKWDTKFDASKCKNSLQVYNDDGSVSYDIDCGYAYILAEAKRLNIEAGSEVFNYGVIDVAMKLFGTGITGNDSSLGSITGKEYLKAGGYYATYYSWGFGEYVGIPWVRPEKPTSWPSVYRYFMPDFYSIYIHSAEVASSYLKDNIRYADVGNIKDSNGNYISDPFYYLKPLACNLIVPVCTSKSTQVLMNDKHTIGRINAYAPDNNGVVEYLKAGGIKSECTDESGMGVLCGLKDEKGNADYIKAIYLYIRALQGNELELDTILEHIASKTSVNDKINAILHPQYKPIEGLTKFLYEVDEDGNTITIRYAIDTKITNDSTNKEIEFDCDGTNEETEKYCKAEVFVFNANGEKVYDSDHYDYCEKNYCYVEIESSLICQEGQENSKLTSLVITEPSLKATLIKKIDNGIDGQQTIFVYDDEGKITGGFCQEITAVKENLSVKCPCDPRVSPNLLESNGNIKNQCSKTYDPYDEMYYGDPSMSSILNACYEEDKLKYDFTDDLNINGNDIVYEAELESKYSFQVKSDDFDVCKLYCRDETRFYIGNKLSVKAGQNLKYDIGQKLLDKKIINETAGKKLYNQHNYMPSVVLQLRECTSEIDYNKWKSLYNNVPTTNDAETKKQKNQLLYSIYNCNLYTTQEIEKKLPDIINENATTYEELNGFAEPAMIEYKYNTNDGTISIANNYGTTKDYLLSQEGCTSLGFDNGTECSSYALLDYDDTYYDTLGVEFGYKPGYEPGYEHGLVKSNLNETIYCSGEACYNFLVNDLNVNDLNRDYFGKYIYNPYASKNDTNAYTTVDAEYDEYGKITKYESGKILNYQQWGLEYQKYGKNSDEYKSEIVDGNEVPTNQYASFIVVTETGFFNNKKYYSEAYTGLISTEKTEKNIELEKNILPLHLNKEEGTYEIEHSFSKIRTAYRRNSYYEEKNYPLFENIKKLHDKIDPFNFVCTYDVDTMIKEPKNPDNPDVPERGLGFTYRIVDLDDMFESVTNGTRDYPENWATQIGQTTLNQIQSSSNNILEHEGDSDEIYSYLEYSYTLTPEGINQIRIVNDSYDSAKIKLKGYLDDTTYGCEYDPIEQIFFNCKSLFLQLLEIPEGPFTGKVKVNKNDGMSEFCTSTFNKDQDYCKYQHQHAGEGLQDIVEDIVQDGTLDAIIGGEE